MFLNPVSVIVSPVPIAGSRSAISRASIEGHHTSVGLSAPRSLRKITNTSPDRPFLMSMPVSVPLIVSSAFSI